MKTALRAAIAISAFAVILTFSSAGNAQKMPPVGAFKVVANDDKTVIAATQFAIDAQAEKTEHRIKLISVLKAERQIVQGSIYRLCLSVYEGAEGEADGKVTVRATVAQDLKSNFKLTGWVEESCTQVRPKY